MTLTFILNDMSSMSMFLYVPIYKKISIAIVILYFLKVKMFMLIFPQAMCMNS
jgi:hypothetical protein